MCKGCEGVWSAERTAQSYNRLKGLRREQQGGWDAESERELLGVLEGQALQNLRGMYGRHVNMILGLYAAMPHARADVELFEGLERQALDRMREGRQLASYMWACAKLGMRPSDAFGVHLEAAAHEFAAQGISNVLWACATIGMHPPEELFEKLCSRAEAVVPDFKPQEISNLLWACATLGMRPSQALFGKLCSRAGDAMQDFKPQELAILMWACAKLEMRPPEALFGKLCVRAGAVVDDLTPQGISNLVWACATLGLRPPEVLFRKLSSRAVVVVHDFNPQDIANVLWACATLGMRPPEALFGKLCWRAGDIVQDFKPQNIANVMWACATLPVGTHPPEELFGKLCSRAGAVVEDFTPQDIANLMWACATLEMQPPEDLFGKLCSRAGGVVQDFKPQEVANLMWACAMLCMRPPDELFGKLCSRAGDVVQDFKPQNIANLMWACAVFSRVKEGVELLTACHRRPGSGLLSFGGWPIKHLRQAHQFLVTCDLDARDAQLSASEMELLRGIKQANGKLCLEAFASGHKAHSRFQDGVASAVGANGFAFVEEAVDALSGYSIDILVAAGGGKGVALEVDGPSHFLGEGRAPKGSTVLKRRHLEQLGYRAVSVPYWDWDCLLEKANEEVYVRGLLEG